MSARDEFREHVLRLRDRLHFAQSRTGGYEDSEYPTEYEVVIVIQQEVAIEGLLDKTPVNPPELRMIASQIRALPLVSKVLSDHPYVNQPNRYDYYPGLPALESKLKEMLDYLPEPTLPTTTPQSLPRKSCGPHADMGKHKSIANVVAPYGNDWRQSENLEKIVAQLDREKVPPSKSWTRRTPPARSWEKAHLSHPDVVVKAIEYSLEMAERKN